MRRVHLHHLAAVMLAATVVATQAGADATADNPLAAPSTLPYHLPPFDRIKNSDYVPAFMAGMKAQRREIAAIAHDPQPATFDNTIVALERSGRMLARVADTFDNLNSCNTNSEMERIEIEMAPKRAAHHDAIYLDAALWARVDALYRRRATLELDAESLQLLERYYRALVRSGARLSPHDQARLRAFNQRIATLTARFGQNVLKATTAGAVVVDNAAQLEGMSSARLEDAARAASARGLNGKWLVTLDNTTQQPPLAELGERALRERIYRASISRATAAPTDNTEVIAELVKLRAERALLLGYASHAAYQLEDEGAGTPAAARDMIAQVAPAALARARAEAADIQRMIDAHERAAGRTPFALEPWDWARYAAQVRKARYDFDAAQVAPYFELERVLHEGVFYAAHELYGISVRERHDLPVYRPDVRVFEVFDADDRPLALFLADYFAHDNKQGGAWEAAYLVQSRLLGQQPVVANHLNIAAPPPGQPVLLTFDEVTTLFHEFGHALHDILSDVRYPLLAGTSVPRDFVEYPSQFNEMWARDAGVVARYARHYQTGAPLPAELLARVLAAQKFNEGYATTEYLEAALIDLAWYAVKPAEVPPAAQVLAFEQSVLKQGGLDFPPVPPRYHSPYFRHVFQDEYSAGYYAYLWSEVLARDTGKWFTEHGGLTRANGEYFRQHVLSRGRSAEPRVLFRELYGRDPEVGPLLEYRGLSDAAGGGGR